MVVVNVKAAEESEEFLYECPCSSTIDEIADSICDISALQSKIRTLSRLLRRLALTDDAFRESYPDVALALERTLSEAEAYASKDQVRYKRFLSPHALRAHIESIEKEVNKTQLMRLSDLNLAQFFSDSEHHDGMQLWWAGKELVRGKRLSDYIGENEKTKIIIRLKSASIGLFVACGYSWKLLGSSSVWYMSGVTTVASLVNKEKVSCAQLLQNVRI